MVAGRVDRPDGAIGQPDIGVQHHRLGAAGDLVEAMRHADRGMFMRHGHRVGQVDAALAGIDQALDDRRKIGPGIGEDIVDAERLELAEQGATGAHLWRICSHRSLPWIVLSAQDLAASLSGSGGHGNSGLRLPAHLAERGAQRLGTGVAGLEREDEGMGQVEGACLDLRRAFRGLGIEIDQGRAVSRRMRAQEPRVEIIHRARRAGR